MCGCCDRKYRAACAQSFAPRQMRHNLSYYCLLAPRICIVVLRAHPVRGELHNQRNTTGEVATTSSPFYNESHWSHVLCAVFFKENVRYPIWICMDPICLILGTRFYLILGTRFEILGTRFGSLKRLKKNCLCVKAATGTSLTSCSQRRFVAIGNPERHVRKASHRGRCVAISLIIACSRYAYVLLFFAHI